MANELPAAIDNTPALTSAIPTIEGIAITTSDNTSPALALPAAIAPAVDTTPVLATPAVEAARANIASLQAALDMLGTAHPASAAMREQLDNARGVLALAQADAALESEKLASIEAARAAAASAKLPDAILAAMLLAIEAQYAPAPPAVEMPAPAAPAYGRKQVSARTAERNSEALAVMAADSTVGMRCAATYNAFGADWASDLRGVAAVAGTRYASIVCFAGAGVANVADYRRMVPQMRSYLISVGLQAGGATYASDPWIFGFGPHAAGGPKGEDTLRLKFKSGASVGLWADGRFRLATRNTAGVRFVDSDAAALAAWNGSDAPATPAPVTPAVASAPRAMPAPTAPPVAATPNGGIASTARCQHCTARNFTTNAECSNCHVADWQAA